MAGQQSNYLCHSLDIEILDNRGKCRPNYAVPRVVKAPAIDWLVANYLDGQIIMIQSQKIQQFWHASLVLQAVINSVLLSAA